MTEIAPGECEVECAIGVPWPRARQRIVAGVKHGIEVRCRPIMQRTVGKNRALMASAARCVHGARGVGDGRGAAEVGPGKRMALVAPRRRCHAYARLLFGTGNHEQSGNRHETEVARPLAQGYLHYGMTWSGAQGL